MLLSRLLIIVSLVACNGIEDFSTAEDQSFEQQDVFVLAEQPAKYDKFNLRRRLQQVL